MADAPRRIAHLDVLRGVAMLGILPVNLWFFGMPSAGSQDPAFGARHGAWDTAAFHLTLAVCTYKFISIFSFLFGAGLALVYEKTLRQGAPWAETLVRRSAVLFTIGVLHAVLLWRGDVVSIYAPIALVVGIAVALRPRTQAILGGALIVLPFALIALQLLGSVAVSAVGDAAPEGPSPALAHAPLVEFVPAAFEAVEARSAAFETEVFVRGDYLHVCAYRAVYALLSAIFSYGIYFGWRIAGLMLLGMSAMRGGWLRDPAGNPGPCRRLLVWGFVIGVPGQLAASLLYAPGHPVRMAVHEFFQYTGSLGLAAAYAGGIALLTARLGVRGVLRPFAAVGRTAFSNYVLQSILAGSVFYGVGAGLFGTFSHAELWGVALSIWTVELIVSTLWLAVFKSGPVEWTWRRLARLPEGAGLPA